MRGARLLVAAAAVGLALTGCSSTVTTPSPTASQAQNDATSNLPARWWIWTESVPSDENPIDDVTGASCGRNQATDIWFLAGTHGGSARRQCTVPGDRPVYFPIVNRICTLAVGETAQHALTACAASVDSATATLDGKPLPSVTATSATAFPFTARPQSATGLSVGVHQAVAWGMWVGPLPLAPGKHVLAFTGVAGSFRTDVTYDLTVSPVNQNGL